jgi:hypothetical protein
MRAAWCACLLASGASGCGDGTDRAVPDASGRPRGGASSTAAASHSAASGAPSLSGGPSPSLLDPPPACAVPSLAYRGPLDGRSSEALARCVDPRTPGQGKSNKCADPTRPLSLLRLRESVPPIDAPTRARIADVARKGRGLGRNPRAFGLAGDSMTISGDFMTDLGARRHKPVEVAPELEALFALPSGKSVLDFFRGQKVERSTDGFEDSFTASRAAKVGVSAPWLTTYDDVDASPIGKMVQAVNPAYAVVLVGGNDAARRLESPELMAADFERDLDAIVVALERRGVVPILSTLARHLDQPGVPNCDAPQNPSDHRVGVVTTAISDAVARYACREHLPLVDVRHALDDLPHSGLGADGMHPNVHSRGGSVLTAEGLACGYNVRNAVTLEALARVIAVLVEDGAIDPG